MESTGGVRHRKHFAPAGSAGDLLELSGSTAQNKSKKRPWSANPDLKIPTDSEELESEGDTELHEGNEKKDGESGQRRKSLLRRSFSRHSSKASKSSFGRPIKKKSTRDNILINLRLGKPLNSEDLEPKLPFKKRLNAMVVEVLKADSDDQPSHIIYFLRDFYFWVIHLVLVILVMYGIIDFSNNYYIIVVSDLLTKSKFIDSNGRFATFHQISTVPQIWNFLDGVVMRFFYPNETSRTDLFSEDDGATHSIWDENRLVGPGHLRQVRVRNESCTTVPMFADLYKTCYGGYSEKFEDKMPFGLMSGTAWTYTESEDDYLQQGTGTAYKMGGYSMNFSLTDFKNTGLLLRELENNNWICQGTRAVFLDFILYSKNTFCVVNLIFELLPVGGVHPIASVRTFAMERFSTNWGFFVLSCEFTLLIYTLWFTIAIMREIKRLGPRSFFSTWIIFNIFINLISYATLVLDLRQLYILKVVIPEIMRSGLFTMTTFMIILDEQVTFVCCGAFLVFCLVMKIYQFSQRSESQASIICAFNCIKGELITFTLVMFGVLFGLSFVGSVVHIKEFPGWKSVQNSFVSLFFLQIEGPYYYKRALRVSQNLVKLYFSVVVMLVVFIFSTTYAALVVYGFQVFFKKCQKSPEVLAVSDLAMLRLVQVLRTFGCHSKAFRISDGFVERRNQEDYDAFAEILSNYGWTQLELRLLNEYHELKRGDDIDIEELGEIYNDFHLRNQLFLEVEAHVQIEEELQKCESTILNMQMTLEDIKSHVEYLTDITIRRNLQI